MKREYYVIKKEDCEYKTHDHGISSGTNVPVGGLPLSSINHITMDANNRIGHKINVHKLEINAILYMREQIETDLALLTNNDCVAIDVILDKQPNGTVGLIGTTDDRCFQSPDPMEFRAPETEMRYVVLGSKKMIFHSDMEVVSDTFGGLVDGTGDIETDISYVCEKRWKKWQWEKTFQKPITIEYSGSNGTTSQIKTNNFMVMLRCTVGKCYIDTFFTRLTYTDE